MRWIFIALLGLLSSSIAAATDAVPPSLDEIIQGVESTYKDVSAMRADFVQTTRSTATMSEDRQKGRLYLKRPRMMRMETQGPNPRLVVTDGATIWIYSPNDKQVFVYKDLGGDSAGMGVLLEDLDKIHELFDITLSDKQQGAERRVWTLDLVPRNPTSFKKMRLVISKKKYELQDLVIIDQMDNETELAFSQVKMNIDLPDGDFSFEPPKGTQLIEGM